MVQRLGYSKSRNGCQRCKKRRVKCDEKKPCSACTRHGVVCSLVDPSPEATTLSVEATSVKPSSTSDLDEVNTIWSADTGFESVQSSSFLSFTGLETLTASTPTFNAPSPLGSSPSMLPSDCFPYFSRLVPSESQNPEGSTWVTDLELMHHYSTVACFTLPRGEQVGHIWQTEFVRLALNDEPLMHQILAIAAFHLAYCHPNNRRQFHILASHHQSEAAQGLRKKLMQHVTPENAHACFAASSLMIIGAFAAFCLSDGSDDLPRPSLQDLLDIFGLNRGMDVVLRTWEQYIHHESFADLFKNFNNTKPMFYLEAVCKKLSDLGSKLRGDEVDDITPLVDREISNFIQGIEESIHDAPVPELRIVMLWPITMNKDFFAALGERQPMALTVLAYYCSILHEAQSSAWYLQGWGMTVMNDIVSTLPADKLEHILWPKSCMGQSEQNALGGGGGSSQPGGPLSLRKFNEGV
ncbi:hypothetical protein E8E14_009319 [Neopestalotiopsis sp. 37M]|nr:hypothetical protein E8E14_009319 [Neopestalotiopsis sp. 37M]